MEQRAEALMEGFVRRLVKAKGGDVFGEDADEKLAGGGGEDLKFREFCSLRPAGSARPSSSACEGRGRRVQDLSEYCSEASRRGTAAAALLRRLTSWRRMWRGGAQQKHQTHAETCHARAV